VADFGEGDLEIFSCDKGGEVEGFEQAYYFRAKRIISNRKYCSLLTSLKFS